MALLTTLRTRLIILSVLLLSSLAALIVLSGPPANAAAPTASVPGDAVPQQKDRPVRRESAQAPEGAAPRTGPASPFKALDTPLFGDNYRANIDPQSPNRAQ